ncbi:MAG TPA: transcription-repair coupling factor [Candidatus Dormibacteraeota bacterium]|nr:transcription-repair coupling factor [Candidatus Dormibacteraeota bacterium]
MSPLYQRVLEGWAPTRGASASLARLPAGAWALVAGALARRAAAEEITTLVLVRHPDRFLAELRPWLAGAPAAYLFAEVAISFLDRPPAMDPAVGRRLEALAALAGDEPSLLVSSRRAAMRPTIAPQLLASTSVELKPGGRADLNELASQLVELGYSREALVEEPGQFSVRGGILDVFPATGRSPVRAEFFGDEVESLRLFDAQNQRSIMPVPRVTIRPGRELVVGSARGQRAASLVREGTDLGGLRADVRADWEDDLTRLAAGATFPGLEFFSAYLDPSLPSLFDHLPESTLVIDFEPSRQITEVRELEQETRSLSEAETVDGELPAGFRPPLVGSRRLEASDHLRIAITAGEAEGGVDLGWRQPEPLVRQPANLKRLLAERSAVILVTEQSERLEALLGEAAVGIPPREVELDLDLEAGEGLQHAEADLPVGVENPALGLTLLSDHELFGRVRRPVTRRSGPGKGLPTVSLEFQPGELVVHVDHGVGRFRGMSLKELDGAEREYLELEYAEGDRLFVPVEFLDRVQKYLGGGEGQPPLNRLGTGAWEKARSRAKKAVEDIADDLLKLYAAREAKPGIVFEPDTPWQGELEASFPFEETADQLTALAEIKADMESERPMDRLLCGDVGFGKTELALRAAFKAVQSGKQVAMLVPTTILTQQHFLVFKERLAPYPIEVAMLSRFASDEEADRAIAGIKAGTVDIVIGTHRVLQKDVRFKRLGLVIIDEEQRFGVVQKERLKRLRSNVDVLTLSATPIPRTLHMAMAGIRDMSVIQTPPEDRQPIKTYVTSDEDELVRQVIERELDRGGQVYFLHNRVRTIQRAAERVQRLVPRARVAVGHGQMAEDELARVMVDFNRGRFDVLVCTTIIESGLDIPNVNTILVENADRFGLSQLYQLRGRVGRAGKRAYCYLLFDPTRSLTETADKRLDVMQGLHELGMGFKIALRDLEIRGAGNLLGSEQHGAIAAVGFEMYVQMLGHAVQQLRTGGDEDLVKDILTTREMNLNLPLDHFIPRSYIRDERLRLQAYRELAAAEDEAQLDGVFRSLKDRYGSPPQQLDNLAYSLRVKLLGQRLGLQSVVADGPEVVLTVDPDRPLDVDELVRRSAGRLRVTPNRLKLRRAEEWRRDLLELLAAMEDLYGDARISAGV